MLNKYDYRILRRALRGELKLDSPRKRANAARVTRKLDAMSQPNNVDDLTGEVIEPGDTVIELIHGEPYVYTQPEPGEPDPVAEYR